MLNRQLTSSSSSLSMKNKKKKKESPRSPLRDLNSIAGTDTCSSSSISVEAPKGCLRFFLSNSSASKTPPLRLIRPNSLSKTTPKSAPNANPSKPSSCSSSSRSNKPPKENLPKPTSQKEKPKRNPLCLYQWQSGKRPNSKTAPKPKPSTANSTSGSIEFCQNLNDLKQKQQQCAAMVVDESGEPPELLNLSDLSPGLVESSTPVGKVACGPVLGCEFDDKLVKEDSTEMAAAAATTTPPVQASVSPEIQCGSSVLVSAATPVCYGAGYIVSGVTDRRKCRARGILTVGEFDSNCGKANIFDNSDDIDIPSKSTMSLVPLPAEASMRWLLSPCDEEDEDHKSDHPENGLHHLRKSVGSASVSSPFSGREISSDLCNIFENSSTISASSRRKTRITLLSPIGNPAFPGISGASFGQVEGCSLSVSPHATPTSEAVIPQEQRKYRYDPSGDNSPFSIESLGSGNVIQTPQSDLSSDRHVGLSWLNKREHQKHDFGSEIDSVAGVLLRASLSPKNQISIWDPPGLSFQFSDLISPFNSIDFTQFPNTRDNHASCISSSTLEDMSQSQMRISWRDGLVSRIFEMDEFSCCRCLSDDENDVNECSNGKFKSRSSHDLNVDVGNVAISSNGFGSPEVVGHEPKSDGEGKEKFHLQRSHPCTESICIDAGGLVASGDSDWTLCYKNQLFES